MIDKLLDAFLNALELFRCWVVVDEFERGVLLRFGRFVKELGPGPHWCWPLNVDRVIVDNVVIRTHTLGVQSLTTKDNKSVAVNAVVSASIRDIRKATLEVESMDDALVDSCCAAIGAHVDATDWADLRGEPASEALLKVCRKRAWRYGIEIHLVQFRDMTLCKTLRLHTSANTTHSATPKS